MVHHHCFLSLLRICCKQGSIKSEWVEHISSWSVLICWAKTNAIKKRTEALLEAGREVGLEVNAEKSIYEGRLKGSWTGGSAPLLC
jgi:hypothetical protein